MSPSHATAKAGAQLLLANNTLVPVPEGTLVTVYGASGGWADVSVVLQGVERAGTMQTQYYSPLPGSSGTEDDK